MLEVCKYKKKPIVIEAIQFTGENTAIVDNFIGDFPHKILPENGIIIITTLEGEHIARIGDFVIKGAYGEFYPCKPDIFLSTYDIVEL